LSFFQPQSLRTIQAFANRCVAQWDTLTPEQKASGEYINPDEPIVIAVPNPEWEEGEAGPYETDDEGNEPRLYFHVESHGGGGDVDDAGEECGHQGANLTGMEMNRRIFDLNGRRLAPLSQAGKR